MDRPQIGRPGMAGPGAATEAALPGLTSIPKPTTVQDVAPKNLQQWWWRRLRVKPKKFYKRVLVVTPEPARPFWREFWSKNRWRVWTLAYEGRYWIEHSMFYSALQTRVVRQHWPNQDLRDPLQEDTNLAIQLMNSNMHVLEFRVLDDMVGPIRGRVKAGLLVLIVAGIIGTYAMKWMPWSIFIPFLIVFFVWVKFTLQGGIGNVGVAKQVCGVTNPFILTPYQLIKHIESRRELVDTEGVVVE